MNITFSSTKFPESGSIAVGVFAENIFSKGAEVLNEQTGGFLKKALSCSYFSGKKGEVTLLPAPSNLELNQIILVGLGKKEDLKESDAEEIGAKIFEQVRQTPESTLSIALELIENELVANEKFCALVASGFVLRSYAFNKYKTNLKETDKNQLKEVTVFSDLPKGATDIFKEELPVVEGVFFARDLVIEAPNVLIPESFMKKLKDLTALGLKVDVLDEKEMKRLGMGALLGVAQGSVNAPYLVSIRWEGADDKNEAPIAFVGKGVTFDSGGISIKPSQKMDEMKMDMAGAAVVSGLMKTLALRQAKVNVVGVVGLVENMPDAAAQRPGDIVTSLSGQTIEVLNTDAEGRLVLADALWYTQQQFKPKLMIDLATLTGAVLVCFGSKFAGLLSNDEGLAHKLKKAGDETQEHVWQLPLDDRYDRDIDSKIADMKNIGEKGAGTIIGGQFLKRFVNNTPWAHLDIAGTSYGQEPKTLSGPYPIPTGFGVRLLNTFLKKFYEGK